MAEFYARSAAIQAGHEESPHVPTSTSTDASARSAAIDACDAATAKKASATDDSVRVGVWGCGHGELDRIYQIVDELNSTNDKKIDVVICCGDFQCVRNATDLECLSCPPKYRAMHTFHEYYSGKKVAPVLTLFVGGNHEASNYLQELPYGGWVAPNMWYMGTSGVVNVKGIRIAGISGIYKSHHYRTGYYEIPPYNPDTLRSVYHMREFDVWKMLHVRSSVDVMITHDWPAGVYNYGDKEGLLRRKTFFREEVETGTLGNPKTVDIMTNVQPYYWFAAHLHVKFSAAVPHPSGRTTRFLALDKCLPGREFFQVCDIPVADKTISKHTSLAYDSEWLQILRYTHELTPTMKHYRGLPAIPAAIPGAHGDASNDHSAIPAAFVATAPPHDVSESRSRVYATLLPNPQTDHLLSLLGLRHIITVPSADGLPSAATAEFADAHTAAAEFDGTNITAGDADVGVEKDAAVNAVVSDPQEISLDDL